MAFLNPLPWNLRWKAKDFDVLYHYGTLDDIWLGNWGLLRSFEKKVPHLLPLPDRICPPDRSEPLPCQTGELPPPAESPGEPCDPCAPIRKYEVVAIQADIVYNDCGDHDPFGIIFVLAEDEEAVRCGNKNPEPLVLRGNVGDCIEVTLVNKLDEDFHNECVHGYPAVPVEAPFPPSCRISMHPQMLAYDVNGSDGATVGFNPDQTVGPGESITYRWYVDQNVGACNLWDMADIRNHRHHGAFGMFIAEPEGSKYLDPVTRKEVCPGGSQVIISHPYLGEFREFAIFIHDGVRLLDKDGELIIDPMVAQIGEEMEMELEDFEDQGSRAFNYRNERLTYRFEQLPDVSKLFSSKFHGDPSTPIFLAYPEDPVKIRFTLPADRARGHAFTLHGHKWQRSVDDINSEVISVRGQNVPGARDNFELFYGAGGYFAVPGDYMYRSGNITWDIELGMWGIIRVLDEYDPQCLAKLKNGKNGGYQ